MEHISGLQQFMSVVTSPDNIPIGAMLLFVLFFNYVSFRQARRNDYLIEHGRRDLILKEMQK